MPDDIKRYEGINNPRRRRDVSAIPIRSTYSPTNAEMFRKLFDDVIVSMQPQFIDAIVAGYTPNTLYIKMNDALKWLCDNHPEKDKYSLFRTRIAFTKTETGVHVRYKTTIANIQQRILQATGDSTQLGWKDDFMKWFETAKKYDIFERKGVFVTEEQKKFVEMLMFQLNDPESQVEITSDTVKVMR